MVLCHRKGYYVDYESIMHLFAVTEVLITSDEKTD